MQNIVTTYKRYRTLQTHVISTMPVVILMPHSACNCRCVMCDIWKANHHLKQLTETDIATLLQTLKKLGTQQVLMSGGEALLHPLFFSFCSILKKQHIKISLLSTGLLLKKHAAAVAEWVDDVIVSLDGDETMHDHIRNIPGAYDKLTEGIYTIKKLKPHFRITARTVIHQQNFRIWPQIIECAQAMGLDQISFLPADVSSHAFNRAILWDAERQQDIVPSAADLPALLLMTNEVIQEYQPLFESGFIAESPAKLKGIYLHYAAYYGLNIQPVRKCNAPWVSAVVEADGTVRPCFFHAPYGNIKHNNLHHIINSNEAIAFRKNLDMENDDTCKNCVCSLYLKPQTPL
ncbi:MAG: radical SAM protein [Bacteroidetes bacterium]|nr:radical SAM protein [Bacteroidota bacterium]